MSGPARIVCLDGTFLFYRSFFAGRAVDAFRNREHGAAYLFARTLTALCAEFVDDQLVCMVDVGKSFRHDLMPDYKGQRLISLPSQDRLTMQRVVRSLNIPVLGVPGYEADDVIASAVTVASAAGKCSVVVTADKDLLQLVDERVSVYHPLKKQYLGEDAARAMFGVPPPLIPDVQAMCGDKVDNYAGAVGVGPKRAAAVVNEWGSLEAALNNLDSIKPPRVQTALRDHLPAVRTALHLARLRRDVPFTLPEPPLGRPARTPGTPLLFKELKFWALLQSPAFLSLPELPSSLAEAQAEAEAEAQQAALAQPTEASQPPSPASI